MIHAAAFNIETVIGVYVSTIYIKHHTTILYKKLDATSVLKQLDYIYCKMLCLHSNAIKCVK